MKTRNVLKLSIILLISLFAGLFTGCGNKGKDSKTKQDLEENKPLNISIFIDLSDRLVRDLTPSQMSRDTAIVSYIVDYFKSKTLGPQILSSKNKLKVFFYPAPQSTDIATLANDLSVDMDNFKGVDKRKILEEMKDKFQRNLTQIYDKTIKQSDWIGCDIWDFFSSKKVDTQCVRKGARNILIILTDGYLYDENHKIMEGNAYSYISPTTLNNPKSLLICKRKGLENLEVRILEVNPYDINHRDRIESIMKKWLTGMGVEKENITIAETDMPVNTQTIIKSFLDE